ncbi:Bug family tripartite tricarboxylate transporter substrate binding protein [Spiribacter halobius]|uniref:Transporter n=1 Tax=Sediminicurvatus halobius TaxID=2182432 RepID=A0A2U2MX90_9GAMM|nr:tripartite tricarboxylate transporter substrate binding protein [Spiribacter halobius]PWG61483.1 transporter [Spiribacter halobius]UEX77979.1 tripartite tricarboxylate transporter substrate binding protein [Spiribacter halobius]
MENTLNSFQPEKLRKYLATGVSMAVLAAIPFSAGAQDDWPTDTIEVVSHASAGGGTDTTIRMWLEGAREQVDEDVRVVYKLGGGARLAHEYMVQRGPDCHTIMALTQTHLYTIARGNSPIEIDDIQGVARAMSDPSVIVVSSNSPLESYEEVLESSRDQALTWGVTSIGSTAHIGISRWSEAADAEARVVPFGGDGDTLTALRSGAVDITVANASEALDQINEGVFRPLAVLSPERLEDLPNVPSTYEHGHEISVNTTRGYYVHADTSTECVSSIEEFILTGMESERFHNYLSSAGLNPERNIAGAEIWDTQIKEEYQVALKALRKLEMTDR